MVGVVGGGAHLPCACLPAARLPARLPRAGLLPALPQDRPSAWNKGLAMPQSTRNKISKALKQRWKDPEYRSTVQVALKVLPRQEGQSLPQPTAPQPTAQPPRLRRRAGQRPLLRAAWPSPIGQTWRPRPPQGKPAWNKGITLSDETRAKMSRSKMDHTPSKATRKKISLARKGSVMSVVRWPGALAGRACSPDGCPP